MVTQKVTQAGPAAAAAAAAAAAVTAAAVLALLAAEQVWELWEAAAEHWAAHLELVHLHSMPCWPLFVNDDICGPALRNKQL